MPMAKLLTTRAFDPETTSLLGAERDMNRLVEEALALLIVSKDTSARGTGMGGNEAHLGAVERHPLGSPF
jgi:hypothetical protein